MSAPTRADLIALLSDVEEFLAKRVDVVDVEGSGDDPQPTGPNEAMQLSVDVSRMREALEKEKDESPVPPMVCPGSTCTPASMSGTTAGSGTCGICEREVAVGPMGTCATHPWPFSPPVVEPERLTAALIRWLDENVSKCGHGYVFVTCARCVIDQGGLR